MRIMNTADQKLSIYGGSVGIETIPDFKLDLNADSTVAQNVARIGHLPGITNGFMIQKDAANKYTYSFENGGVKINGVAIGTDMPDIDYRYEYETIGVTSRDFNLRLQSPRNIVLHTGYPPIENGKMIVTENGNVGIGTPGQPTAKLEVQGEVKSVVGNTVFYMVPKGAIIMWSGSINKIPPGWALCDGDSGTPDLRNRFVVGAGVEYQVHATGGQKEVALTIEQMPRHNHNYTDVFFMEWNGDVNVDKKIGSNDTDWDNNGHARNANTGYTGGRQVYPPWPGYQTAPHENRPPYYALAFIMKL